MSKKKNSFEKQMFAYLGLNSLIIHKCRYKDMKKEKKAQTTKYRGHE